MASPELLVHPTISKNKFEREVAEYRKLESVHRARGWFMLDACFPEVFVIFAAPQLTPPALLFGVVIEFSNYDLWPPSVTIVDPFTRKPLKMKEIKIAMNRRKSVAVPGLGNLQQAQSLLVAHDPEDAPFLCIPGVREYHEHPAHTGNSWLLHRTSGVGTLYFLLDQISKYGVEPLKGYQIGMTIVGYAEPDIPE